MGKLIQWAVLALMGLASMVGMAILNALVVGLIVMLLWNWLVPAVLPALPVAKAITYWQGWGLIFLIKMFQKSK